MAQCSNCFSMNEDGARFCFNCGQNLMPMLPSERSRLSGIARRQEPESVALLVFGWISALLFPIIGFILGIIVIFKYANNKAWQGILMMMLSVFMWSFWAAFWPAFYVSFIQSMLR